MHLEICMVSTRGQRQGPIQIQLLLVSWALQKKFSWNLLRPCSHTEGLPTEPWNPLLCHGYKRERSSYSGLPHWSQTEGAVLHLFSHRSREWLKKMPWGATVMLGTSLWWGVTPVSSLTNRVKVLRANSTLFCISSCLPCYKQSHSAPYSHNPKRGIPSPLCKACVPNQRHDQVNK